jgi:hypothetical protein
MSKFYLVKLHTNWADEMDVDGFRVFTKDEWESYKDVVNQNYTGGEHYVGTNESVEWDSAKDYFSDLSVEEITETVYQVLLGLFGKDYGLWIDLTESLESEEEE